MLKRLLIVLTVLAVYVVSIIWLAWFMRFDCCIDSGGSWDNEKKICSHT